MNDGSRVEKRNIQELFRLVELKKLIITPFNSLYDNHE